MWPTLLKSYLPSLVVTLIVFLADIVTPLDYTFWVFYIIPLLVSYRAENPRITYTVLILSAVLLVIGLLLSPTINVLFTVTVVNRMIGFLSLTVFSLIITNLIRRRKEIVAYSEEVAVANSELRLNNKELESLSSSISHDLRNPILSIKGFSAILLEFYASSMDSEGKDYLKRIIDYTDKMNRLIDDMLTLFRISRQDLKLIQADMGEMAREIETYLRQSEPQRVVTMQITGDLTVRADPNLLKIALNNLLGNAWKYTAHKESAIIEFGVQYQNGRKVYYVKDNGSGFDMKYSSRLFEPFERLHSEKEFSGTGIGLSIVRRVIVKHGGEVWGEGKIGEGAVFYFTLP